MLKTQAGMQKQSRRTQGTALDAHALLGDDEAAHHQHQQHGQGTQSVGDHDVARQRAHHAEKRDGHVVQQEEDEQEQEEPASARPKSPTCLILPVSKACLGTKINCHMSCSCNGVPAGARLA